MNAGALFCIGHLWNRPCLRLERFGLSWTSRCVVPSPLPLLSWLLVLCTCWLCVAVVLGTSSTRQLADIVSSGGPHGFLPGQSSTASPGPVHVDVHLPDSAEWVQMRDDATSKPYFWNRRTRATMWKPPPGIRVVWVGEKGSGGEVWYWHKGTRASTCDLLSEAHRGEGLGIPSLHLGCHFWRCSVSCCCLRSFRIWIIWGGAFFPHVSVFCTSLVSQWIHHMRQSSVLLVAISHISV